MAQYRNAVMTQNGAALLNKAQAGLCKIKFIRMSTGDGQYSESEKGIEELRKITSLKSHKQSFAFDSIKYQDDTSVELKASITNHDDTQTLSAGYYIREIAVFAQEDDKSDTEVLYSIAVADVADFLPTYNGNNPILIIQKYYVTVDESRSAITVPSHYGEDLDAVKEDLEKEWKEYAKNIDEEMKKRPEKDGKADEMTVTFTEAANRENIVTGEKASTLMGKIKKWLADLAAAAFMQVVTSYSDLMAGTALDDYLIGAAAAKEGFTELNRNLVKYNEETDSLDVFFNGEIAGSFPCGFQALDLYNYGDECVDVTGGWTIFDSHVNATFTKNANGMYLKTTGDGVYLNIKTANTIDFSKYSKLCIETSDCKLVRSQPWMLYVKCGGSTYDIVERVSEYRTETIDLPDTMKFAITGNNETNVTITVNNGGAYADSVTEITIHRIYLIK